MKNNSEMFEKVDKDAQAKITTQALNAYFVYI